MQVEITEKQLMRLRRAADITEIQNLMARLVEAFSRMDVSRVYEDLFAVGDPEVSIELAESGGYDGPEHVQAFLNAYDAYLSYPKDKRGWMELQNICNPTVIRSEDGQRAVGTWALLAPSAKWAMPYPCDQEKLTAFWGCGKYYVHFIKTEKGWKIQKLQLIWYLRSPFELGWMKQPDCVHMPVLPGTRTTAATPTMPRPTSTTAMTSASARDGTACCCCKVHGAETTACTSAMATPIA